MTRLNQPTAFLLGVFYALAAVFGHGFHNLGAGCCESGHMAVAAARHAGCGCGVACQATAATTGSPPRGDSSQPTGSRTALVPVSQADADTFCIACELLGLLKLALSQADGAPIAETLPALTIRSHGVLLMTRRASGFNARGPPAC